MRYHTNSDSPTVAPARMPSTARLEGVHELSRVCSVETNVSPRRVPQNGQQQSETRRAYLELSGAAIRSATARSLCTARRRASRLASSTTDLCIRTISCRCDRCTYHIQLADATNVIPSAVLPFIVRIFPLEQPHYHYYTPSACCSRRAWSIRAILEVVQNHTLLYTSELRMRGDS